nr:hypothetical protein [Burkholderia sp. JP2-270]
MEQSDPQRRRCLFERQQPVDEFFLEDRHDGFPRTETFAPLFDLLDERIERLLGFRQAGCLVAGRDDDRGSATCGHD